MLSFHAGRLRLGAAIATVLAVTLGSGALTVAPANATAAAPASQGPGSLLPMVPGATLASAGADGFLTHVPHDGEDGKLRWTPYGGGASRDIVYVSVDGIAETSGDTVVTTSDTRGTQSLDLSTGVSFTMSPVDDGPDSLYGGLAGKAVFVDGATKLWMETKDAAPRPVQGLRDTTHRVRPGDATHGLIDTDVDGSKRIGLIDLSDATVSYPYPQQARNPVVSGNRLAWVEDDTATGTLRVVVHDRTTGAEKRVPVPGTSAGASLAIGLLGDWVTYGATALHITDGETVSLLDSADRSSTAPDGSAQIIQGSSSAQGDGVFRVALDADGRPAVQLLAHAGTPTTALHDFDNDGLADLLGRDASGALWRDSAYDGRPRALVGGGWQIYDKIESVGDVVGAGSPGFLPELVARDADGVLWLYSGREAGGFDARRRIGGGWQVYTHLTGGSDFTGDGRPDLVAVDAAGVLWLYRSTGDASRPFDNRRRIGTGWDIYNQLTAVGNLAGAAAGDLVARDRDGVTWLYLGKGDGTFTRRTKIGGGWQGYSELVGAGDVDHDGKADLFAYYPGTSTVYLYTGTGDRLAPFNSRVISDAQTGHAYDHVS
ncbi:VCBS repeat-containing protein [Streptomyces sp. HPF1205]|uniref:FG-GAP repeat domain-containing protein n=1 Tax=Streptomyces sp. HPF1205 TaxID=2873262 RepID=UPI001CEC99FF|nr:VCBS repeat-containing protein [Streptomyces sp. HPF1205]